MICKPNARGFLSATFRDRYGKECSIQESSIATEYCMWLGCDEGTHVKGLDGEEQCCARMHLTQKMAASLLPLLEHFVLTGTFPREEAPYETDE